MSSTPGVKRQVLCTPANSAQNGIHPTVCQVSQVSSYSVGVQTMLSKVQACVLCCGLLPAHESALQMSGLIDVCAAYASNEHQQGLI